MTNETLYQAISGIRDEYLKEAKETTPASWRKWAALVACLCLVVVSIFGIGFARANRSYKVVVGDSYEFSFYKTSEFIPSTDMDVTGFRDLTETEITAIFDNLQVEGIVGFDPKTNEFLTLEGTLNQYKLNVLRSDTTPDTIIEGTSRISTINGVPVTCTYFLTKPNACGKRTMLVSASFPVGNYVVYLEGADSEENATTLCEGIGEEIVRLLESGSLDFTQIK